MQELNKIYKGKQYTHINDVFAELATLAKQTAQEGNYGVSAMLLDEEGKVIAVAVNTTVSGFRHRDEAGHEIEFTMPHTDGHAEKNLIRLLHETNKDRENKGKPAFDPQKLTMVVNLDCCPQCLEASLKVGGKGLGQIINATPDPGVALGSEHYRKGSELWKRATRALKRMPISTTSDDPDILSQVEKLNNDPDTRRMAIDASAVSKRLPTLFAGQSLDLEIGQRCDEAYNKSRHSVRQVRLNAPKREYAPRSVYDSITTGSAETGLIRYYTDVGKLGVKAGMRVPDISLTDKKAIPEEAIRLIVGEAAESYLAGNFFRACAFFSPEGHFIGTKHDNGFEGAGSLHSALERSIKAVGRLYGNGGPRNEYAKHFPSPRDTIFVTFEPSMGALVRAAGESIRDIRVISYTPEGFLSAGNYIPPFYMSSDEVQIPGQSPIPGRGMEKAFSFVATKEIHKGTSINLIFV